MGNAKPAQTVPVGPEGIRRPPPAEYPSSRLSSEVITEKKAMALISRKSEYILKNKDRFAYIDSISPVTTETKDPMKALRFGGDWLKSTCWSWWVFHNPIEATKKNLSELPVPKEEKAEKPEPKTVKKPEAPKPVKKSVFQSKKGKHARR